MAMARTSYRGFRRSRVYVWTRGIAGGDTKRRHEGREHFMKIIDYTCERCGCHQTSDPGDEMEMYSMEIPRAFVGIPAGATPIEEYRATHLDFCSLKCLRDWLTDALSQRPETTQP